MEREHLSFDPVWIVPWITHMMFVNLKDNFASTKTFNILGYLMLLNVKANKNDKAVMLTNVLATS